MRPDARSPARGAAVCDRRACLRGWLARPYIHGLSFVIRAEEVSGTARRLADLDATATREREIAIPTAEGRCARASTNRRAEHVGWHCSSPGCIRRHRRAAPRRAGAAPLGQRPDIVTPDIPELSRFEIAPAIVDAIEQAGLWLSSDAELAPDRKVALMGISFSGGLSAVAAGRPSMADRVAFVFSFGGHADLPRVLRYLCTGVEPRPGNQVRLRPDERQSGSAGPAIRPSTE